MPVQRHHQVIVIGAGIAGRAASRRVHGARIVHGAQFVTARDPRFVAQVEAWLVDGTMARWTHGLPSWTAVDGWREASVASHPRFVSPDGMNALGKALAQDVTVTRETHVTRVRHHDGDWCAETRPRPRWRRRDAHAARHTCVHAPALRRHVRRDRARPARSREPAAPLASEPAWTEHHRWRYAQPERTLPEPALALRGCLVVGGDTFGGGRVEGAYLSGLAAAERIALGA